MTIEKGAIIMKIKYYGTAAAEGIPALFCYCDVCEKARKAGGRNIRTRSQTKINDDLLIDFSADTYSHVLYQGLDLREIKSCLITHGHDDHLYPYDFIYRLSPVYAHFPNNNEGKIPLDIYLTRRSAKELNACFKSQNVFMRDKDALRVNFIKKFVPFETAGYTVTALRATHALNLDPVIYIIQKDGKSLLYAHDTGYFPDDTWKYIEKSGIRFDYVSLDCTSTKNEKAYNNHMGLKACCEVKERLMKKNADEKTIFCVNHFSHNGGYTYDELVPIAEKEGFIVSYDSMEVEF